MSQKLDVDRFIHGLHDYLRRAFKPLVERVSGVEGRLAALEGRLAELETKKSSKG